MKPPQPIPHQGFAPAPSAQVIRYAGWLGRGVVSARTDALKRNETRLSLASTEGVVSIIFLAAFIKYEDKKVDQFGPRSWWKATTTMSSLLLPSSIDPIL